MRVPWTTRSNLSILKEINPEYSLVAQLIKNLPSMQETLVQFLGQEDPCRKDGLHIPVFLDFSGALLVKNPPAAWETWV